MTKVLDFVQFGGPFETQTLRSILIRSEAHLLWVSTLHGRLRGGSTSTWSAGPIRRVVADQAGFLLSALVD